MRIRKALVGFLLAAGAGLAVLLPSESGNTGWLTYHGQLGGNRYSPLTGINTTNVNGLKLQMTFPVDSKYNTSGLETTPVVSGTTMFFTATNSVYAYNLTNGQPVWSFERDPTPGLVQGAAYGHNRGVALSADSVFLTTDNAHLISLNRTTGVLQWETVVADSTQNYGCTGAPLYLPGANIVVTGVSGGDSGARGFLSAYNAGNAAANNNQAPLWQFFTTPGSSSDPLAATWGTGAVLPHGCGATWTTGTYDTNTHTLYWGVGNACRDYNGDDRAGDNLYASSVVALSLNPRTGKLTAAPLWYFQFTPHGLWDYDGSNVPMLITANWQGTSRNMLLEANRNGFFYVLDRGTGQYLAGFPFVNQLNWASGLDAGGRPVVNPAAVPTTDGVMACPSGTGATNWMASAFSPATGNFYVQALEYCSIYTKGPATAWAPGAEFKGGEANSPPGMTPKWYLYAFNPFSQPACTQLPCPPTFAWKRLESTSATSNSGGVLATAGGLVFAGAASGAFIALDAQSGSLLWTYAGGNGSWRSSPMTCQVQGKQLVAIASPTSVLVFGL